MTRLQTGLKCLRGFLYKEVRNSLGLLFGLGYGKEWMPIDPRGGIAAFRVMVS